jgi:hypothetical protein
MGLTRPTGNGRDMTAPPKGHRHPPAHETFISRPLNKVSCEKMRTTNELFAMLPICNNSLSGRRGPRRKPGQLT